MESMTALIWHVLLLRAFLTQVTGPFPILEKSCPILGGQQLHVQLELISIIEPCLIEKQFKWLFHVREDLIEISCVSTWNLRVEIPFDHQSFLSETNQCVKRMLTNEMKILTEKILWH